MTSFPGEVDLDLTNTEAFASAGGHYREGERLENTEWRNGLRPFPSSSDLTVDSLDRKLARHRTAVRGGGQSQRVLPARAREAAVQDEELENPLDADSARSKLTDPAWERPKTRPCRSR